MKGVKGKKVFIGLSGGVDSSVSAALLKKAGYDVTGVFIKVWQPDFISCNWRADRLDAMRVCARLEIPFLTLDLEQEYKKEVVDYMICEYKEGRTPNPDVMCNKNVKFGAFLKKALEMGADYIATGHYAQNIFNEASGCYEMRESADMEKDQTYFLWTLTQDQLRHVLFPVGHLRKAEVRKLAKKFGLATAEKKDSQGLCFIGKVDMKDFLSHYLPKKIGRIEDEQGNTIGTHEGAYFYTIGQRHGFSVSQKGSNDQPFYVVKKNIPDNTITVSNRTPEGKDLLAGDRREIIVSAVSSTTGETWTLGGGYKARIRYRQPLEECTISSTSPVASGKLFVRFSLPQQAVSSGQSLVIYKGGVCVGGGVIV